MGKLRNWLLKAAPEQQEEEQNAASMEAMASAVLAAVYAAAAEYGVDTSKGFTMYPIADDDGDADGDGPTLFCVCVSVCDFYVLADGKNAEVVAYYCYSDGYAMYCSADIEKAMPTEVEAEDERAAFAKAVAVAVERAYGKKKPQGAYKMLVKSEAQQYTLGVAYPADSIDAHGEFTDAVELEKAAWDFMRSVVAKGDAGVGTDHADGTDGAAVVVESYIYRGPEWEIDGEVVAKSGDWMVGAVWTNDGWERVQKGELTGWSIQGTAVLDPEADAPAEDE